MILYFFPLVFIPRFLLFPLPPAMIGIFTSWIEGKWPPVQSLTVPLHKSAVKKSFETAASISFLSFRLGMSLQLYSFSIGPE